MHTRPGPVCAFEAGCSEAARNPGPGFCWMVLPRHGLRPLAVLGRSLLLAHNRCAGLPCWSEIAIFETAGPRFAASLRHTPPRGAVWCDGWLCDTPDAVRARFDAHDPLWALPPELLPQSGAAGAFQAAWRGLLAAVFGLPAASGRS